MDVRIGVIYTAKEIELEIADDAGDRLQQDLEAALGKKDESGVLWVTDRKGRRIGVPANRVAYVEIGSPDAERRVGFGV